MSKESNAQSTVVVVIVTSFLIITMATVITLSSMNPRIMAQPPPVQPGPVPHPGAKFNFGTISSVQLDKNNKPDWILSGHWRSNLLSLPSSKQTNTSSTITNATAAAIATTTPVFNAEFEMVMVNGSGFHRHTITNFALTKTSAPGKGTTEFNGTVAISLKNGPVSGVQTSIQFMGNHTISIWLNPSRIQNHFGSTPIFGTVFQPFSNFGPGPPRMNMR